MSEAALSAGGNQQALQQHISRNMANSSGTAADQLFREYGIQNVLDAVTNLAVEFVQKELNAFIDSMDMPQFMKDDAKGQVSEIGNSYTTDTPRGAQDGVNQVIGNSGNGGGGSSGSGSTGGSSKSGDDVMSGVMDMLRKSMQDETEASSKGSGGTGGGRGNWLAVLARALGATAGQHLKKMVELGEKMGGLDSKENPEEFAKIQAEFQAEAQIFKMFQEAIGTMVKSIGEGMSSVARKQ